ncbi:CBO0543 family protein [Guptibacillus spartinae]|uniref:CBO0543 family protein n=1 Tax=Guptibacillus spartinae TaxID=3025679 RepID=UPI00235FCC8B|nr:CBO0543 family protein [Pseudalkalibacillus spartinae]
MVFNIVVAFVIPWLAGIFLVKKDFRLFLLIAPFAAFVAVIFDVLGFHFDFWRIDPEYDTEPIAALPMYFGVYPILTGYLFLTLERQSFHPFVVILFFSLITTIIEGIGVWIHLVHYSNGWTIYWTYVSYFLAYIVCYGYYRLLKKYVPL